MDRKGYEKIAAELGRDVYVSPRPEEDGNVQFVTMNFEKLYPSDVLNILGGLGVLGLLPKRAGQI